jgi:hypothetical protein
LLHASAPPGNHELVLAKDADTVLLCDLQFAEWKKTLWNDINTDEMEGVIQGSFVKEVRCELCKN